MMGGIGAWEILVLLITALVYIGIPVAILYLAIRGFKRIFRQLDQIQEQLQSIRAQLDQTDRQA